MKKIIVEFDTPEKMIEKARKVIQFGQQLIALRDSEEEGDKFKFTFKWDMLKSIYEDEV